MQKPIIAFVCEGAQKDLMESLGTAVVCNPDEVIASMHQLKSLFNGEIKMKPNVSEINKYTRKSQTATLASLLNKIIQP
jgi:hypothetical protein